MRPARGVILLLAAACHDEPAYEISEAEAERYAELRCRAKEQCCGEPEAGCVERWRGTVLDWREAGEGDLTFSKQCMADALAWMETLGCEEEAAAPCKLASGPRRLGEACMEFGDLGVYGIDCDEGLQCWSGVCVDDPRQTSQAPPGGFCDGVAWECEPEYYCSDQAICEPRVALGQPCGGTLECLLPASNYCAGVQPDTLGRCMLRPELGEACVGEDECGSLCDNSSCTSLECIEGTCEVPVRGPAVCQ